LKGLIILVKTYLLPEIIVCPLCKVSLSITETDTSVVCTNCQSTFKKGTFCWNFIPTGVIDSSPLWEVWQELQSNSLVGYQASPEQNLSVGDRDDCQQFAQFCNYHGLILDVGCGPQPWPAYFDRTREAIYIGVDPLAGDNPAEFLKFKALAEFLPFRANIFNHVLFSTSLDHFVDPIVTLDEAARVCKSDGEIDIWLGEKRPNTPQLTSSPEWYLRLKKPDLAEDRFHIKRLDTEELLDITEKSDLILFEYKTHQVDYYRTNHFYRFKCNR
jgi:SAM-dependent methyltransferase